MWLAFLVVSAEFRCWLAGWFSVYAGRLAVLTMLFGSLCFICWLTDYAVYVGCLNLLAVCRLAIMVLLAGFPAMLENLSE